MPLLDNPRYERFAQLCAQGVLQTDAYVQAGFESEGADAISTNSSRLAGRPEVRARRDELLERAAKRAELRISDVTEMLMQDRALARSLGQPSASIRAAELLGKQLGMFVDRKEIKTGNLDDLDPGQLDRITEAAIAESARRIAERSREREEVPENPDVLSGHRPAPP
jgi:hypothetical protein